MRERKKRNTNSLCEWDMVSIPEEISWIYVDVVIRTMQRTLRNSGADNYCMDSLTLSIKHLSPIWAVCLSGVSVCLLERK